MAINRNNCDETFDDTTDKVYRLGRVNKKTGKKDPSEIKGYYIGSQEYSGKFGPSVKHVFKTQEGVVGVWGTKQLNKKLSRHEPGTHLEIEYTGLKENSGGLNPTHTYYVGKTKNMEKLDSSSLPATSSYSADEDGSEYSTSESSDEESYDEDPAVDEDEAPADEVPPARAAAPRTPAKAPSAERQAHVKALLSKSRSRTA